MKKRLKFKKLLNESKFLQRELELTREILSDVHYEFDEFYNQYCLDNNIDIKSLKSKHSERVEKIMGTSIVNKVAEKVSEKEYNSKQVFRDVARKLHPDVVGPDDPLKNEYEEAFKQANNAIEKGKWSTLFDIADQYDIEISDYDAAIEAIKKDIKRIKNQIDSEKNTYSWKFYQCEEDDNCRKDCIEQFLRHLFVYKN